MIDAPAETVWRILIDYENHPNWNPFIRSIKGDKFEGGRLTVFLKPPDSNGMTFNPVIRKFESNRELRWKGKLGIKGLFDGEHFFIIERAKDNQVRFIHGEKFTGILVWMMSSILEKTREGFNRMNIALKRECEK